MASPPLQRASSLTTADDITGAPGACALSGQFPIEPSHDSLHDTVTASNRLSFSRRLSLSNHTDVRTCALNLHYRFPMCAQDSMGII